MKPYPSWFKAALLACTASIYVSGGLLVPTTLEMRAGWELPWRLSGDARLLWAAGHAAAAFLGMMILGALWATHMRSGWRRRMRRVSGTLLALAWLALAMTALGVYYLGDEDLAKATALAHAALGLTLVLPFGYHWMFGRRRRHH